MTGEKDVWRTVRRRPFRWALPALALLVLVVLQWQIPDWTDLPEGWAVDARFRLRGETAPQAPIVVVALDEASFQTLGELRGENIRAWPRAKWAELVERIAAADPRVIGIDVVFDTPGWDEGGDAALASALAEAGNVVLAAHLERSGEDAYENVTLSPPIAALAEPAAGTGLANFSADADGTVRRTGLLYAWGGDAYPSFSLVVATLFAGERIQVGRADLALDGTLPINYRGGEGAFPTISMIDVWQGEVAPERFEDAIVLVGYTTQLEQDRHQTPFADSADMPGVEIQANAVDTLLAGDWIRRPPGWVPVVLVGLLGALALAALSLPRSGTGVLALMGIVVIYLLVGVLLFHAADLLLPVVAPAVAAAAVGGTSLAERLIFAERDKRRLRRRFAGVMSPERLEAVLDNWDSLLDHHRPQKEATILFADVRGFTSTTEALMRQGRSPEMVRFLTAYLDAMAEAVFTEGGAIYDVIGDGLMILFGLPEPASDHALRATRAAVRMAQATEELQAIWPLREERPLAMGIGIHCGVVVDAVIGRGRRMEYSVVGDPVNTAARIESHCKVAMEIPRPPGGEVPENVTILLSGDVYEKVREKVVADSGVPPFEARGKSEALQVVRLLGLCESEV
ncbi:MAG: adenylate/guanylate cyclase domain-containing protein [Anaerolineae bacterium]